MGRKKIAITRISDERNRQVMRVVGDLMSMMGELVPLLAMYLSYVAPDNIQQAKSRPAEEGL